MPYETPVFWTNEKPGKFRIVSGAIIGEPGVMMVAYAYPLEKLKSMGLVGIYRTEDEPVVLFCSCSLLADVECPLHGSSGLGLIALDRL